MSRFFIDRPIFAWVVAIVIMIVGAISISRMAVEQYPPVAPTQITVSVTYPGATSQVLEEMVLSVIEREMNSAKGMTYMETTSESNGRGEIIISFEPGIDPDMAQVDVQNLLARATPRLPAAVTQQGVFVRQSRSNFMQLIALTSNNPDINEADLNDYAARNIVDELSRVNGVGQAMLFGAEKAMRIWVDPSLIKGYNMALTEVVQAVASQNTQVSGGTLGDTPTVKGQEFFSAVVVDGLLETVEDFENIVLRANTDGSTVKLKDVARVEVGQQLYSFAAMMNGQEIANIAIMLRAGGNALATAKLVNERMGALAQYFPEGVEYSIPYDTTKFISASIEKVVQTLFEAILLVFLVMYVFLQNVRYTIIPTIVVPIALLGGFASLFALGFSINVLTMFAMVLVIGIVVDDAIIVVENVERIMRTERLSPLQAARKAMDQIQGAIIGVTVVLISVFIPLAFFAGSTGNIYRQFAATMTTAIGFSAFMALSLTPALCATMLKPVQGEHHEERKGFFGWFNRTFEKTSNGYKAFLSKVLHHPIMMMGGYVVIVIAVAFFYKLMPTAFMPQEDQGVVMAMVQLPPGASAERTEAVLQKYELYMRGRPEIINAVNPESGENCERLYTFAAENKDLLDGLIPEGELNNCGRLYALLSGQKEVENTVVIRGFSFGGQGHNAGAAFMPLKDWSERTPSRWDMFKSTFTGEATDQSSAQSVAARAMRDMSSVRGGFIYTMNPPPIMELGTGSGFDLRLEDRAGHGHEALLVARNQLLSLARSSPIIDAAGLRADGLEDSSQTYLNIDRERAQAQGVDYSAIASTLGIALGSSYVNDYVVGGRTQRVMVQAEAGSRMQEDQLLDLTVLNNQGKVVPFSAFATTESIVAPVQTVRYNGYPAMKIVGDAAAGYSTGEAMNEMERLSQQLPDGFAIEWTGQSREEKLAGGQIYVVIAFAVLAVFLCLAALYESWSIPVSVMLVVPLGVIGAILATLVRGLENDVYFLIGLITVVGLSAKNAVLIVEFAKDLQEQGKSLFESALEAAMLRFRPILMTSLAFICGVIPLALATGASSASQRAIGTSVVGGMITGTVLAVLFVPTFFMVIRGLFPAKPREDEEKNNQFKSGDAEVSASGDV